MKRFIQHIPNYLSILVDSTYIKHKDSSLQNTLFSICSSGVGVFAHPEHGREIRSLETWADARCEPTDPKLSTCDQIPWNVRGHQMRTASRFFIPHQPNTQRKQIKTSQRFVRNLKKKRLAAVVSLTASS